MLKKIIEIKNVGILKNCVSKGDTQFHKLTLLFAENGRGKSTLCAILRSLQTAQVEFISERETLGISEKPSIDFLFDTGNVRFCNNNWLQNIPNITLFDSVFIQNNVYAGDYVEHEQRKNLYRVIDGEKGVELADKIDKLDKDIRDVNPIIASKKDALTPLLPVGVSSIEKYLALQPDADIEQKIEDKRNELAKGQLIQDKSSEILSKKNLTAITLPAIPADLSTILLTTIDCIEQDAEDKVKAYLTTQQMGDGGEKWLSEGMGFLQENKCPFCSQSLTGNELITAYRSHFNQGYKQHKNVVQSLLTRWEKTIGEITINNAFQAVSNNAPLIEFWKQFVDKLLPEFPIEKIRSSYKSLYEAGKKLLDKKVLAPLEVITTDTEFDSAVAEVNEITNEITNYNLVVDECNNLITEKKKAAQQDTNVIEIKKDLTLLESHKNRFDLEVVKICNAYKAAIERKKKLEEQKEKAKKELDTYCQNIFGKYQSAINEYLGKFNTGFRIINSHHQYVGGTPNSHYKIEINGSAIDLGNNRTQFGTQCFKTLLSAGDRSALALAFFFAALKQNADIANTIVVLDDPFNSQDSFRRTCTQQLICEIAEKAKQAIVLSHDISFLKSVYDNFISTEKKVLKISHIGGNNHIEELDIVAETLSVYLKNHAILSQFYNERQGSEMNVVRAIRPLLEGWLRRRFPMRFGDNQWLGDFIKTIRCANDSDGLVRAKDDLSEIESINNYSKQFHHDQNSNADSERIDTTELHGFVKRTLQLVGTNT
ncbi:hypothetical protein FACS1894214_1190 [Planctomycetales bacterium]|nr:hypothetical protein FACS1894214_1190 [Planctomycetales bacterium]